MSSPIRGVNARAVLSYLSLGISYSWKISQLYGGSTRLLRLYLRGYPEQFLESRAARELKGPQARRLLSRFRYKLLSLAYFHVIAFGAVAESFSASLWFLTCSLIWGTLQLEPPGHHWGQDSDWTFGQILPLLLLLQPLAALVEHFSTAGMYRRGRRLVLRSRKMVVLLTKVTETSQQEHSDDEVDDHAHQTRTQSHTTSTSLSTALRAADLLTAAEKARATTPEPHIDFMHGTTFFKVYIWILNLCIAGCLSAVCYLVRGGNGNGFALILNLAFGIAGALVLMATTCLFGICCSRVFK